MVILIEEIWWDDGVIGKHCSSFLCRYNVLDSVSCRFTDMKFGSTNRTLRNSRNRCRFTEIGSSVNRNLTDNQPKFVGHDTRMMILHSLALG